MISVAKKPDETELKKIVRQLDLPKGVRLRNVFLDVDHSGDPAAYVIFSVAKDYGTTALKIRVLNDLRKAVSDKFDELWPGLLNYVRFADASPK